MRENLDASHWLYKYGNKSYYAWQQQHNNGRTSFYRPLGLVEFGFDADGRFFEGRADLNSEWTLAVSGKDVQHQWKERLILAWAVLRNEHALLQSRTESTGHERERGFVIDVPRSVQEAREEAAQNMTFLQDHFDHVDPDDFYWHCQNSARLFNPDQALTRLFVYGLQDEDGETCLKTLLVAAHQICDGLSMTLWHRAFVHLMNLSREKLTTRLANSIKPASIFSRLPPAQEALYQPPISNPTPVRLRWFWLLTRIRRHVRRPLAQAMHNPLHRPKPLPPSPLPQTYHPVLSYTAQPPLTSAPLFTRIPLPETKTLHTLCRRTQTSIGAGLFALVAHLMTTLTPPPSHLPFKTGFPLNPRPFLASPAPLEPDSLMLSFCDGIILPYLPPHIPLTKRLATLAKSAHAQLKKYQKRKMSVDGRGEGEGEVDVVRSVIAEGYLASLERVERLLPAHLRKMGEEGEMPQGGYPVAVGGGQGTCGVSSVGRRDDLVHRGMYDVTELGKEWVVDHREVRGTVRAREGEFLVGIGGDERGIWVSASCDTSACDGAMIEEWRRRFETSLDGLEEARL